jgi:hypothetical protein
MAESPRQHLWAAVVVYFWAQLWFEMTLFKVYPETGYTEFSNFDWELR